MTAQEKARQYYKEQSMMFVSVDCVIFGLQDGRLRLLLIKRDFEPHYGEWSLMGGFVGREESVDDAARRVLCELTGLHDVYMRQTGTFGAVDRDPGERVVSVAYTALLNFNDIDHDDLMRHNAHWVDVDDLPLLCFDHSEMITASLAEIKRCLRTEPLAFSLLPSNFTLRQLQELYEDVEGITLDKRNFRRRVLENSCIIDTGLIDKTGSKRGARLYRYDSSVDEGFKL